MQEDKPHLANPESVRAWRLRMTTELLHRGIPKDNIATIVNARMLDCIYDITDQMMRDEAWYELNELLHMAADYGRWSNDGVIGWLVATLPGMSRLPERGRFVDMAKRRGLDVQGLVGSACALHADRKENGHDRV